LCQVAICLATSPRNIKNFVRENASSCGLCQVENERFRRNFLSKSKNLSNRTDLKTKFLKTYQTTRTCRTEKISQAAGPKSLKTCQNAKLSQPTKTLNPKDLSRPENVSSGDKYCHQLVNITKYIVLFYALGCIEHIYSQFFYSDIELLPTSSSFLYLRMPSM
jgi:hypothetical protein